VCFVFLFWVRVGNNDNTGVFICQAQFIA